MTIKIEEGRTYSEAEWCRVRDQLRQGDKFRRMHDWEMGVGGGVTQSPVITYTVTHLAPRTPSWAGAQVVLDRDENVWQRRADGYSSGIRTLVAEVVERHYAPITVLLDADGHIPVASLMEVNGVSREDLRQALRRHRQAELHDVADRDEVDAVLAALEGGR